MNGGAYEERTHQADNVGICETQKRSRTSSLSFTIFLKTEKKEREPFARTIRTKRMLYLLSI